MTSEESSSRTGQEHPGFKETLTSLFPCFPRTIWSMVILAQVVWSLLRSRSTRADPMKTFLKVQNFPMASRVT